MHTSRRHAIRLGISATASLVALPGLGEAMGFQSVSRLVEPSGDSSWLRRDLFEGCVGESVSVRTRPSAIALRLLSVEDPPKSRHAPAGDENNFVVVFRGPCYQKLTQGTYQIESRILGTFELFLVPGWTNASGTVYTATFNRLA